MTDDDIERALEVCDAASTGPAVWAADHDDTEESAVAMFLEHYRKAMVVTGSAVLHQVDLPDARTAPDGTALCMAMNRERSNERRERAVYRGQSRPGRRMGRGAARMPSVKAVAGRLIAVEASLEAPRVSRRVRRR